MSTITRREDTAERQGESQPLASTSVSNAASNGASADLMPEGDDSQPGLFTPAATPCQPDGERTPNAVDRLMQELDEYHNRLREEQRAQQLQARLRFD